MKVLISLAGQAGPRNIYGEVGSNKWDGFRIQRYGGINVKPTKPKIKQVIKDRSKKNTDMNGGSYGPLGRMHMRKANWLGLLERGRER
jgi:hypothetical protein